MEENSARESDRVRSLLKKLPAFYGIPNICVSVHRTSSRASLTLSTGLFIWYIWRGTCCSCYTERAGDRMRWLRFTPIKSTGSDIGYCSYKIMTLYYPSIYTYVSQLVCSLKFMAKLFLSSPWGLRVPPIILFLIAI